ncbi:MAG: hypothetical protein RSH78_00310 [Bacilli bacterium]|uniref:hypothetical protein n=1 Tax=Clostridium sp. TaxID=1506 RepID=UPI002FC72213
MAKELKLRLPSNWDEDGMLANKKFSYMVYLAILRGSKKSKDEDYRYKYDVTVSNLKRSTGLDYCTCKRKLQYLIEQGFIIMEEDNLAKIPKIEGSSFVLLTETEIETLLSLGSKSEYSIRIFIYLKRLEYPSLMQGTKIKPSQECIARRVGLSPTNKMKIQKCVDELRDCGLIVTKKYWLQEQDVSPKLIMEYMIPGVRKKSK